MKIIILYNHYRSNYGGESIMVNTISDVMKKHGHDVLLEIRDSRDIKTVYDKLHAFISGFYSRKSKQEITVLLKKERPDIVHIHNLYPLFSPSILEACRDHDIPVVMSIHNFNLTCPIGLHEHNGEKCIRCLEGKEYWCILLNCAGNMMKSVNYGLRHAYARKKRFFYEYVDIYIAATHFMKNWLISNGYTDEKIVVIPHMLSIPENPAQTSHGTYVLFAGRLERAKGIDVFLNAASKTPEIPCMIVGDGFLRDYIITKAPPNVSFAGSIPPEKMDEAYRNARFVVFPSLCFEGFGLVAAEALSYGLPVIASNVSGLEEIIEDGVNGFLFEPGDGDKLSSLMKKLWNDPDLCSKLGLHGRKKTIEHYNEKTFYKHYFHIYKQLSKRN